LRGYAAQHSRFLEPHPPPRDGSVLDIRPRRKYTCKKQQQAVASRWPLRAGGRSQMLVVSGLASDWITWFTGYRVCLKFSVLAEF